MVQRCCVVICCGVETKSVAHWYMYLQPLIKKDANKALMEAETPQTTSPLAEESRSRKKKSFGDDFLNEDNQGKQEES